MLTEQFGARLKKWHEWRKMSQKQLAKAADTYSFYIDALEMGKSLPSLRMVERLLDALNVDIGVFFGEDIS